MEKEITKIKNEIDKFFNLIRVNENTSNALDFVQEIKDYLMEKYNIN